MGFLKNLYESVPADPIYSNPPSSDFLMARSRLYILFLTFLFFFTSCVYLSSPLFPTQQNMSTFHSAPIQSTQISDPLFSQIDDAYAVKSLLEGGKNPDIRNSSGQTALISASSHGYIETLKILLDYGASIEKTDQSGQTALMVASSQGQTEAIMLLLKNGAHVNATDLNGRNALMLAKDFGAAKLLLENGADVNAKTNYGSTALIMAASKGDTKTVETLLNHGADVNAHYYSTSALKMAEENGYQEIVKLLLEKGARTPTHAEIIFPYVEGYAGEAVVRGKMTFKGIPPPPLLFDLDKFPQPKFCGQVDNDGRGHRMLKAVTVNDGALQDVVVYIQNIAKGKSFHFDGTDVLIDRCRFLVQGGPSTFVGVVVKGAEFSILNGDADPSDPKAATGVLRNPHLYEELRHTSSTIFNLPMPYKGQILVKPTIIRKKESILHLQSDQGNYMNAYFFPVENPYYAIVGTSGLYQIDQVPSGKYELIAWHPVLGIQKKEIEVSTTGMVTVDFEFSK